MPEPHPRWARAKDNHVLRAREILKRYVGTAVLGRITAENISSMPPNDVLNLAQKLVNENVGAGLSEILNEARTLDDDPPPAAT